MSEQILNEVQWNPQGLVSAIAQDVDSGDILMLAWMNRESLALTIAEGEVYYWSRSRQRLWHKGEESGNIQVLRELRLDCDGDAILLKVEQQGGVACHTGRKSCFFRKLGSEGWMTTDAVIRAPAEMYSDKA